MSSNYLSDYMGRCKLPIFNSDITFSEVPNEISYTVYISGCPYNCKGCFWKGREELSIDISLNVFNEALLDYKNDITCVCFLGGEWNSHFTYFLESVKNVGLKTCLYTGIETYEEFDQKYHDVIMLLDYIKVGSYKEEFGTLLSSTTNQRFYELENGNIKKEIKFYGVSK